MPNRLKVLIVDDSVLYRKVLSEAVAHFPDLELLGSASSGELALKRLESTPADLVFCDVYMPGLSGVETLLEIRRRFPDTVVIMVSGVAQRNTEITIQALESGALDFIQKPEDGTAESNMDRLKSDVERVTALTRLRRCARELRPTRSATQVPVPEHPHEGLSATPAEPSTIDVVAIGASTGGPEALGKLVPQLPGDLGVPVLIVQHMPPGFTRSLADSLGRKSRLKVVEADEGFTIEKNTVYIAPGGKHMTVRRSAGGVVVGLNNSPPENSVRPSVDVLFRSVTDVYGSGGIAAVVLTGMGSDGVNGVRAMKRRRCYCITQTEQSCVVYGMPRAVEEEKLSDISLPIDKIAGEICRKLKR